MEKCEGGGQEVGGPSTGASRKWATTNVVARFLPFILPSPATNACYTQTATSTTSLASKREPEVVFFVLSTCHPPPPSHPNMSQRWFFSTFRHVSRHHHLPRVLTRAGGGFFRCFDMSSTTTTSLASKCELEVVFFDLSTRLPPPPPPSHPNASRRWFFSTLSTRFPPPPPPLHPNASRRWFFFDVFFYYGWDEGVVFIPHAAPFDFFFFCSQQYVVRS